MTERRALTINGRKHETSAAADTPFVEVLRNEFGLVATRFGCGTESCGACIVLLDGRPTYSCTLSLDAIGDKSVTTLEGLAVDGRPTALQQAFLDEQAGQCGYCLSGILMSATALLAANPSPTRAEIQAALDKHLCRCGAHNRIIRAVERAAKALRGAAVA